MSFFFWGGKGPRTLRHPVQEFATNGTLCYMRGEHGTRNTMFLNTSMSTRGFTCTSSTEKSKDLLMQLANLQLVEDIVDGDFIFVS